MKKVIVAESSPTIKSVADSLLRQSGYDVVCTSDGLQAWEVISAEKPDLVLVGLNLSGISGLDLCRQISSDRMTGGIPVVLMVGANDSAREDELASCGARGRLKKPFSPRDLLDIVGRLVGSQPGAATSTPISPETKFVAQVSSTQHLQKKPETYNLEWLDLSDTTNSNKISKIGTFDLASDDQTLVLDTDQYGLANPIAEPEPKTVAAPSAPPAPSDDDYGWFVGEMQREMEGKSSAARISAAPVGGAPKVSSDIGFEDIRPSEGSPVQEKTASLSVGLEKNPFFADFASDAEPKAPPPLKLSDEQIGRIADQIAARLAAHLISRLDRNLIIEAIRSELKL